MLRVQQIVFGYTDKNRVLDEMSFRLKVGEHLCIMGESGSGKSTLLKAIYGLVDLKSGKLFWKNEEILGPSYNLVPGVEFFKYVPQNFELMPFTTVEENISKHLSRFDLEGAKKRVSELLEVIEMSSFAKQKVKNLSGGQQQRVAIARALAKEPELILLDEPFSQIDNFKKNSLRRRLFAYLKQQNISCIVATHDGDEALAFSDQMIVIKDHKIFAKGKPKELYKNPTHRYVASLFDDVNEISINAKSELLYPQQISVVKSSELVGTVLHSYFKGTCWLIEATFKGQTIYFESQKSFPSKTQVHLSFQKLNK